MRNIEVRKGRLAVSKSIVVVGSVNVDLVVSADRIPHGGETVPGSDFQVFSGGKGANQAVAAARLGVPVSMIAKLGDDAFSTGLRQGLNRDAVNTVAVKTAPGPSGVAVIATDPAGENTIIVVPGANGKVTPADLEDNIDLLRSAGILLCQLEIPMETVKYLAEIAERYGTPVVLDPAPAQILPGDMLRRMEWVTPNETEACRLLGVAEKEIVESALPETAEQLLGLGPRNVIIKLGGRGCYLAFADGRRELVPAFRVQPVDTTAAGDAFNGAFAACLVEGRDPLFSVVFACAAAAISVTRHGAQPSMPKRQEVLSLLAEQSPAALENTIISRD
jgi:ribokinase